MKAIEVAKYYLSKDINGQLFNNNIVVKNERKFYEGNARLNKYLFLAQVVYLARYERKLFDDDFVAYDNGPVLVDIMKEYSHIANNNKKTIINDSDKIFLDKIYDALKNATYEELIDITHEDPEWIKLSHDTYNAPVMNLEENIAEYQKRYKGLIEALKL